MSLRFEGLVTLLQVFDMPRSVAFYRDVLGFTVVETSQPREGDDFDWGLLKLHDIALMINKAYEPGHQPPSPDPARVAGHADTTLFFGCRDLDAAYTYLRAKEINAEEPVIREYGMKQLYLTDPDGYAFAFSGRQPRRFQLAQKVQAGLNVT